MAYRPQWDSGRRSGFGGAGDFRNWTAVKTILVFTVGMFIIQSLLGAAGAGGALTALERLFALNSPLFDTAAGGKTVRFESLLFPLQLVTYTLLHADFMHIFGNMLLFLCFATDLEASMGKTRLLRLYVMAAVVGALAQVLVNELLGMPRIPTIGASGAVSGIVALGALRDPRKTIMLNLLIPVPAWLLAGFYFANDFVKFISLVTGQVSTSSVAVTCHLGGALIGVLWWKRGDVVSTFIDKRQRAAIQKKLDGEETSRREMDRILAKIQAEGLNSLSKSERSFLQDRSRDLQGRR